MRKFTHRLLWWRSLLVLTHWILALRILLLVRVVCLRRWSLWRVVVVAVARGQTRLASCTGCLQFSCRSGFSGSGLPLLAWKWCRHRHAIVLSLRMNEECSQGFRGQRSVTELGLGSIQVLGVEPQKWKVVVGFLTERWERTMDRQETTVL